MGLQWPRGLHLPGWPPCFPGSVGRAFTPAAPCRFKIGNIPAAANTPCRGRFYIGPACPAADPRGRAMALPCKPGQTSWPPGLPGTQNLPVGAGFIPPAEPCPAAGCGGMRTSRPTFARAAAAIPFGRSSRTACRGGACPSRTPRRREHPGTISGLRAGPAVRLASETRLRAQCEHRPLHGFAMAAGIAFSRLAAVFPRVRRAGVRAAAPLTIQNREHSRRRKHPM